MLVRIKIKHNDMMIHMNLEIIPATLNLKHMTPLQHCIVTVIKK